MKVRIILEQVMQEKNLTSRQLQILSGVPSSTISDICNGAMPKLITLVKIARGLNMDINELFIIE